MIREFFYPHRKGKDKEDPAGFKTDIFHSFLVFPVLFTGLHWEFY
jgi:hypothetical protein